MYNWVIVKVYEIELKAAYTEGPLYFFRETWLGLFFLVKRDLGLFVHSWFVIADICFIVNVNEFWELSVTREQSQYFYVNAFSKVV